MNAFHTTTLHAKLTAVDRVAWLLATATTPMEIHGKDDTPLYRREHTRLWNLETHRRAVTIREVLDDLGRHA